jgi:hypothetical protein
MAHRKILSIGILGTALMLAGCSWFKKPKVNNNGGRGQKQTQSVKGTLGDDGEPGLSNRSNIRFKKVYLLRNDFARALQLPPNQLCIEAGKDCLGSYNIVLGGVDPNMMLYERIEQPVTTSPIAVERIAMQACSRRVNLDFGGSKSLIFADIPKVARHLNSRIVMLCSASIKTFCSVIQRMVITQVMKNYSIL